MQKRHLIPVILSVSWRTCLPIVLGISLAFTLTSVEPKDIVEEAQR